MLVYSLEKMYFCTQTNVIVGGLPEVVNKFLETKNIELTYQTQRNLIAGYEEDMVKYADNADKAQMYIISIMPLNWESIM